MSGRSVGSSSCEWVGAASRLCDPISVMISATRGNQVGSAARSAASGPPFGNHTPLPYSKHGFRAADRGAREFRVGPDLAEHLFAAGEASLIASAIRVASPQANSSLVCARIIVCCMMLGCQPVVITVL